jgi:hypothetical protein
VVQTLFAQLLDRPADAASEQYFLDQLHGAPDQDVIAQIIASDEFFNKTSA